MTAVEQLRAEVQRAREQTPEGPVPFREGSSPIGRLMNLAIGSLLELDERLARIEREHGWTPR